MTGWLLDTNILSELRRPKPEPKVTAFLSEASLPSIFVSTVTFAEIRFGIELAADPMQRVALMDWLTYRVRPLFENRNLPLTEDIMLRWRLLIEAGRKRGHTFSQPDLLIAATALEHDLTVVTRDTRDYDAAGAKVFNPWLQ